MNSSPGSGSIAAKAVCKAAEPDEEAWQYFAPKRSAKSASSCFTNCPFVLVSVPLWITSLSKAISSFPKVRPSATWSEGNEIVSFFSIGAVLIS